MLISPLKMSPRGRSRRPTPLLALLAAVTLGLAAAAARAQAGGGVESTGTGGNHVIQGRIFLPSGRIADMSLRVKLESMGSGALSVFTDTNGGFKFTSLMAGSYTVVVEPTEQFEQARESVYIDQPSSRAFRDTTPRIYTVYIYLQPKRAAGAGARPPGVLNAVLASVPKPAADLYQKGIEAVRRNDNERAAELLQQAVDAYPKFQLALSELGVTYLKLKRPEKAADAFAASLKLAPEDHGTLLAYGRALLELRRPAEAEEQFRKALKGGASPSAHLYLGMILLGRRELGEAEQELRAAADTGGGDVARAHYYLGGIYWEQKQYRHAADELETYLKLAPDAPEAARVRATVKELRAKQ